MNDKFIYDPHDLSGEKETWKFSIKHYLFESNPEWDSSKREWTSHECVGISMKASRKGRIPSMDYRITVGSCSFPVGQRPERIILRTEGAPVKFTEQLIEQGFASSVRKGVERHQDYPGAEIEEFPWHKIDVTGFYNRYMAEHQRRAADSPVSDIILCEQYYNPMNAGRRDDSYMKCRIGGIGQQRRWVGPDGRKLRKLATLYPESGFHLTELAEKTFRKELELYRAAQDRVTDSKVITRNGDAYLRCHIDGVQQSARKLNSVDFCHYNASRDIHALVARYFDDALLLGQDKSLSQGR